MAISPFEQSRNGIAVLFELYYILWGHLYIILRRPGQPQRLSRYLQYKDNKSLDMFIHGDTQPSVAN